MPTPPHFNIRGPAPARGDSEGFTISGSHVEAEVRDVPVLHDVVLALDAHLPLGLELRFRAGRLEVLDAVDLSPDEAALDVAVDLAGGLARDGAAADGPCAALVRPGG